MSICLILSYSFSCRFAGIKCQLNCVLSLCKTCTWMHAYKTTKICNSMIKNYKRVGAKRPGGNGIGAKQLGCGGETTKEENRGETTWGEGVEWFGGETSCYPEAVLTRSIFGVQCDPGTPQTSATKWLPQNKKLREFRLKGENLHHVTSKDRFYCGKIPSEIHASKF